MQSTLLKRRFEELNMNILKLKYYMNLKYEIVIQPSDDGYMVMLYTFQICLAVLLNVTVLMKFCL